MIWSQSSIVVGLLLLTKDHLDIFVVSTIDLVAALLLDILTDDIGLSSLLLWDCLLLRGTRLGTGLGDFGGGLARSLWDRGL